MKQSFESVGTRLYTFSIFAQMRSYIVKKLLEGENNIRMGKRTIQSDEYQKEYQL